MAGIGFKLRQMTRKGDLLGAAGSYTYSLFLVAGPWIFTVLALLGITVALRPSVSWEEVQNFRSVVIYNFCFTLILTGPFVLLGTRYVADQIYKKDMQFIPFVLASSMVLVAALTVLIGGGFFVLIADLEPHLTMHAIINFGLVSSLWIALPFISIIENFRSIAIAFALGCIAAIGLTVYFAANLNSASILMIFNCALALILFVIFLRLFLAFPQTIKIDPDWLGFLRSRWELAVIGLFYYLGIWIDKIIMWHSSEDGRVEVGGVLSTLPVYDATMFIAQLLAIPAFVMFFVHIETRFYELYQGLYKSFERHVTRRTVEERIAAISKFVMEQVIFIFLFMAIIVTALLLALPNIYEYLTLSKVQIGTFRTGLIGTVFHTTFMIIMIFLLYFDLRKPVLGLTVFYCVLNGGLTVSFLPNGLAYYGAGYMLAGAFTVVAALTLLVRELPWLAYHAFITNNSSLEAK